MTNVRLPLAPRLVPGAVPGETVVSYASRIEGLLEAPKGLLTNKARSELRARGQKSITNKKLLAHLANLLEELCQLPSETFHRTDWDMELAWHSCPECGTVVEIYPDAARYVCSKHLRWTGPSYWPDHNRWTPQPPAERHGTLVDFTVLEAADKLDALRVVAPRLADECLFRGISAASRGDRARIQPHDLIVARHLADVLQSLEMLTLVASSKGANEGYEVVRATMLTKTQPELPPLSEEWVDAVTDQAWMALRPTAVSARILSGRQKPLGHFVPYIEAPPHLQDASWCGEPTGWLAALRTTDRLDQQRWNDRYALEGPGSWVLMCPAGHVLHEHPAHARRADHEQFHCAVCVGSRAVPGFTSLADTDPDIAAQWHPTMNGEAGPENYLRGSNTMVWWLCPAGHSYDAAIESRALKGSGCRECPRFAVEKGENDLATTHPHLAALWDPTAGNPPADSLTARNTTDAITLRCPKGHVFVRVPKSLVAASNPCQKCAGHEVTEGVNDLATLYPKHATWWHPTLNGNLTPQEVSANSGRDVWWLCPDGHPFQSRIQNRTKKPDPTCPGDTGRLLCPGKNDLATKHPDLVRDWDYQRNTISPQQTVPGNTKWWWTCSAGHTQHALTHNRKQSGGCTLCPPEDRVAQPVRRFNRGRQGWDNRVRS